MSIWKSGSAPERAKVVAVYGDDLSPSRTVDVSFQKDGAIMTHVGIDQVHTTKTDRILRNKCCVWLNRNGREPDIQPDLEVQDLRQLVDVLA